MSQFRVRHVVSVSGRAQVQRFLREHIPARYKPLPIVADMYGMPFETEVAAAIEDGQVLGAIRWTRDLEDEVQIAMSGAGHVADAVGQEVRVLQNVAVASEHRGVGLGRALNRFMIERLRDSPVVAVIGVATGTSPPFFESIGYDVQEPNVDLKVSIHAVRTVIPPPIEGNNV